jgi:hypothetical protein
MTAPAPPAMLSIYDVRRLAGFIISRGKAGFEAFTAAEISLGVFATMKDAAFAIPAKSARE